MIQVQSVIERINSALDAEGSDRYLFEQDLKPAINYSVEFLSAVVNKAFDEKKLSGENFRELIFVRIFQASQFSRIAFNQPNFTDKVWTVMRVNPLATVYPSTAPALLSNPEDSAFMDGLSYVDSEQSARRLTLEEWDENKKNVFEAGNNILTGSLVSYAYLTDANYGSTSYSTPGSEIEVRPSAAGQFVGVTYLKYPSPITQQTDSIEFPDTMINLIVQKALNFIAFKQGDQTNLYNVTTKDIADLVQLMM